MRQISCRLERRIETGQFRRLAYGKRESNKRQPTIDLPPRLLAHIRRWHRLGISTKAVVEYHGAAVGRVTDGWDAVVEKAGLATDPAGQGDPAHPAAYCDLMVSAIRRAAASGVVAV